MNLESTAVTLVDQTAGGKLTAYDRRVDLFGNIVLGGLGLVGLAAVAGMIYTVIVKFVLTGEGVAFGIIISLLLIFAVLCLVFVILNESKKERLAKRETLNPELQTSAIDTAKLLEQKEFEPIPTVIEDTTDLLHVEAKTRRL
jgi:hypothetical protein